MPLSLQKPIKRQSPFLIRSFGRDLRSFVHSGWCCRGCPGTGPTMAARKFERRLLQVFGFRPCRAGRTALMRGRMNGIEAGVLFGSTPVNSLIRTTDETRSRRRVGVRPTSCWWRAITSLKLGTALFWSIFTKMIGPRGPRLVKCGHDGTFGKRSQVNLKEIYL